MAVTSAPETSARVGRRRVLRGGWAEVLAILGMYLCYSIARDLVAVDVDSARSHAYEVLRVERLLHLDVEAGANDWLGPHAALAVAASYWYAAAHFTVTPVVLVLLRLRAAPATYRLLRNGLVVATALALIGYATYPLMPPRMLGGYTDTLEQTASSGWWGGDASAPRGLGALTNQYAAMPSMHVGWAVWCALAGMVLLAGRRWRGLVWLYPVVGLWVVVATANHYVLDGVVGAALVLGVCAALRRRAVGAEQVPP